MNMGRKKRILFDTRSWSENGHMLGRTKPDGGDYALWYLRSRPTVHNGKESETGMRIRVNYLIN